MTDEYTPDSSGPSYSEYDKRGFTKSFTRITASVAAVVGMTAFVLLFALKVFSQPKIRELK